MKFAKQLLILVFAVLLLIPILSHAAKDAKGSKDHPLFTRMPGANIGIYEEVDFVEEAFRISEDYKEVKVEGYKYRIGYDFEKPTSWMNISRNYTNAIKKIGGEVIYAGTTTVTMRLVKDGKEVWAKLRNTGGVELTIVEKEEFVQQITANDMLDTLNKQGFIAVDIHFETGKATIMPESQSIVDQISTLMKANPKLGISVEGHTDNVGKAVDNKALSEARAKAVMAEIIKQGVDAKRLSSAGYGQERPVADNRSEEGRAKNRRVELVKI